MEIIEKAARAICQAAGEDPTSESRWKAFVPAANAALAAIGFHKILADAIRLRRIGQALIEADERGQGLPWREAMDELHAVLQSLDNRHD